MMPANNSVFIESLSVVRSRAPNKMTAQRMTPEEAWRHFVGILSREAFTGKIMIEMNCGGIRKIEAEDHRPLPA